MTRPKSLFYRVVAYLVIASQFLAPLYRAGAFVTVRQALYGSSWTADVTDPTSLPPMTTRPYTPPTITFNGLVGTDIHKTDENGEIIPNPPPPTYDVGFMASPVQGYMCHMRGDPEYYVGEHYPTSTGYTWPMKVYPGLSDAFAGTESDSFSLSSSGNYSAFAQDGENGSGITVVDRIGNSRDITEEDASDSDFVWSPNDDYMVFERDYGPDDPRNGLYITLADGDPQPLVTGDFHLTGGHYWSPDGDQLALVGYEGSNNTESNLYVIGINPIGSLRQLTQSQEVHVKGSIKWSPDGSQIAFSGYLSSPTAVSIYVVSADGSSSPAIIFAEAVGFSWAEGNELVYRSGNELFFAESGGSGGIRQITIPQPEIGNLRVNPDDYHYVIEDVRWSPDGSVAVVKVDFVTANRFDQWDIYALYLMNADGSDYSTGEYGSLRSRIHDRSWQVSIDEWSPDSRYIAVVDSNPYYWAGWNCSSSHYVVLDIVGAGGGHLLVPDSSHHYCVSFGKFYWIPITRHDYDPAADLGVVAGVNTCPGDLCPVYNTFAQTQASVGGPVDVRTGIYTYSVADAMLPDLIGEGQRQPITFHRIYSTGRVRAGGIDASRDILGTGWTHNFNSRLIVPYTYREDGTIEWTTSGSLDFFWEQPNGGWQIFREDPYLMEGRAFYPVDGLLATMERRNVNSDPDPESLPIYEYYILSLADRTTYRFDKDGYLLEIYQEAGGEDADGKLHPIELEYEEFEYGGETLKRLKKIIDGDSPNRSRYLSLEYYSTGKLWRILDHNNLLLAEYMVEDNLLWANNVTHGIWNYEYEDSYGNIPLLTGIVDPNNHVVEHQTYDDEGRVIFQTNGENDQIIELSYQDAPSKIIVDDGNYHSTVYEYDSDGTLETITTNVDGKETKTTTKYAAFTVDYYKYGFPNTPANFRDMLRNQNYFPLYQVDANGNYTLFSWEGHLLKEKAHVIKGEGERDISGYDASTKLQEFVSSTNWEWEYYIYSYNEDGVLTTVDQPIPPAYSDYQPKIVSAYEHGDLRFPTLPSAIIQPLGYRTEFTYTDKGYLETVTENWEGDPTEVVTAYSYGYDGACDAYPEYQPGKVQCKTTIVNRIGEQAPYLYDPENPDQNLKTTAFLQEYTDPEHLISRLIVHSGEGAQSRTDVTEFDDDGNVTRTIANLVGDIDTATFNPAAPDSNIITTMEYDAAGRLEWVTAPPISTALTATKTRYSYDAANRLIEKIDNYIEGGFDPEEPDRDLKTTYDYDAVGNLVEVTDFAGRKQITCYDELNRPTTEILNASVETDYCQTPANYVLSDKADEDVLMHLVYDGNGNVIQTYDAEGALTVYSYDGLDRQYSVIQNPKNHTPKTFSFFTYPLQFLHDNDEDAPDREIISKTKYDTMGKYMVTIDSMHHATWTCFDDLNRVVRQVENVSDNDDIDYENVPSWDPENVLPDVCASSYDPSQAASDENDDNEIAVNLGYFPAERKQIVTDPYGHETHIFYDEIGRVKQEIVNFKDGVFDPEKGDEDISTTYTYDALGRQIGTVDFMGRQDWVCYDGLSRVIRTVQNSTRTDYPQLCAAERSTFSPDSSYQDIVVDAKYDWAGNVVGQTDANGFTTQFTYDNLSRQKTIIDQLDRTSSLYYDAKGNLDYTTDFMEHTTSFAYDNLGRRLEITAPLPEGNQVISEMKYSKSGLNIFKQEGTYTIMYEYDLLGRIKNVVENSIESDLFNQSSDPSHNILTVYNYDSLGNVLQVDLPNGSAIIYGYDDLNRRTLVIDPEDGEWVTVYDKLGNVKATTDPSNNVETITYDALGRTDLVEYSNEKLPGVTPTVDFTYNYELSSKLTTTTMEDDLGSTVYVYDPLSRTQSVTNPFNKTTTYTYDKGGRRKSLEFPVESNTPDVVRYDYDYDDVNRLRGVTNQDLPDGQTSNVTYDYDPDEPLMTIQLPNGVAAVYEYDDFNRLKSVDYKDQNDQPLMHIDYDLDVAGNRLLAHEQVFSIENQPAPQWSPTSVPTPIPCSINVGDADVSSLIDAIDDANQNGFNTVICLFADSQYILDEPFEMGNPDGLPPITGDIYIRGNGATVTRDTASANNFRIFDVAIDGSLKLENLTVSNGSQSTGAGINNAGTLELVNVIIRNNTAGDGGGGVRNDVDATAIVTDSLIRNNTAGWGGGIDSDGSLVVSNSVFYRNEALITSGGAIGAYSTTEIHDSCLMSNKTSVDFWDFTFSGDDPSEVDASFNWWGSEAGPVYLESTYLTFMDSVSENINWGEENGWFLTVEPAFCTAWTTLAPEAGDDEFSVYKDHSLIDSILGNDSDPDGDTLSARVETYPENGSLSLNNGGTFYYIPDTGFVGDDGFTYIVSDGRLDSNIATVTIHVEEFNFPPEAENDLYVTTVDTLLLEQAPGVLVNDTDLETDPDDLTATWVPGYGPSHGALTLYEDGSFSYTPYSGFVGYDSFVYHACDEEKCSDDATVTITVGTPVAPVAVDDPGVGIEYVVDEDTQLQINAINGDGLLANDSLGQGGALSAVLVRNAAHGFVTLTYDGFFTYQPSLDFFGTDTFTYKANDGFADSNVATVTITVNPVNDPPEVYEDRYVANEDETLIVPAPGVLYNDWDIDGDSLSAGLIEGPDQGNLILHQDGSFEFTPAADSTDEVWFSYQACDDDALSLCSLDPVEVLITVQPVNDAPVVNDDSYQVYKNETLRVPEDGAPVVFENDDDPESGPFSLWAVLTDDVSYGTLDLDASDGSFTYTPNHNYVGSDSFTYKASDGELESNVATVTIHVRAHLKIRQRDV